MKTLTESSKGWVIINRNHPNNPKKQRVFPSTFSYKRSDCIAKFIDGSGQAWTYWKEKYNFECVKATNTIITN